MPPSKNLCHPAGTARFGAYQCEFRPNFADRSSRVWVLYAASRVLICRTDAGRPTFNAPSVFGQLGQASISMLHYPQRDRKIDDVLSGWAINQGYNIGWNQLQEFTPDLSAFFKRHSKKCRAQQLKDSRSPISSPN